MELLRNVQLICCSSSPFIIDLVCHTGRGVVAFRRWYHGKGQGGPPYFNPGQDVLPPASIPRTQLLDRWGQHTQHCPSCQKVRGAR